MLSFLQQEYCKKPKWFVAVLRSVDIQEVNEKQKVLCTVICSLIFSTYNVNFVNTGVNFSAAFCVRNKLSQNITLPIGWC